MQQADIEEAQRLYDLVGDSAADVFQNHADEVVARHDQNLLDYGGSSSSSSSSHSPEQRRLEVVRAKLELHEIVLARIQERALIENPKLGEAIKALRDANAPLLREVGLDFNLSLGGANPQTPRHADEDAADSGDYDAEGERSPSPISSAAPSPRIEQSPKGGGRSSGANALAAALSRQKKNQTSAYPGSASPPSHARNMSFNHNDEDEASAPRRDGQSTIFSKRDFADKYLSQSKKGTYADLHGPSNNHAAKRTGDNHDNHAVHRNRPTKALTLKELRAIMVSLYETKTDSDRQRQAREEPTDTMEQHMISFLHDRYQTRQLVDEWMQAILDATHRLSPEECDVTVFGKIVDNRLAETSAAVQDTLRTSLCMLLKKHVLTKNAHRPKAEVEALWRARLTRGVPFVECERVVKYMYNEQDSEQVLHKAKQAAKEWQLHSQAEPDTVRYRDLVQVLLRFQVELTERFLEDFTRIFKLVDRKGDGRLDRAELKDLSDGFVMDLEHMSANSSGTRADVNRTQRLQGVAEARSQVNDRLRTTKSATFSECVDIFTGLISARWLLLGNSKHKHSPRSHGK